MMSKESKIKKRLSKINTQVQVEVSPKKPAKASVTYRYVPPRRRFNRRFFILLTIWIVAFVVAMIFIYRR
jgi:hypothetical protein